MLSYYVFWGIFSFFITLALSLLLLNYVKISHFLDSPDNERKFKLTCFFFDGRRSCLHNAPRLGSQGALVARSQDLVVC